MSDAVTIAPLELKAIHDQNPGAAVIDVRTPAEFRAVHAPFATLAPLESLNPASLLLELDLAPGEPLYIFCGSGTRAKAAAERLSVNAHGGVVIVEGGIAAWEAAGLPVVRGRKAISLERQVRIAAGSLVLTGILLGSFVHAALYGLSAFVGAGLVFAGVTDTCGMALLLARMPWNQDAGTESRPCSQ